MDETGILNDDKKATTAETSNEPKEKPPTDEPVVSEAAAATTATTSDAREESKPKPIENTSANKDANNDSFNRVVYTRDYLKEGSYVYLEPNIHIFHGAEVSLRFMRKKLKRLRREHESYVSNEYDALVAEKRKILAEDRDHDDEDDDDDDDEFDSEDEFSDEFETEEDEDDDDDDEGEDNGDDNDDDDDDDEEGF